MSDVQSPFFFFLRHKEKITPFFSPKQMASDMHLLLQTKAQRKKKEELKKRYLELKREKYRKLRKSNSDFCINFRGVDIGLKSEVREIVKKREGEVKRRKENVNLSKIRAESKHKSVAFFQKNHQFPLNYYKNKYRFQEKVFLENIKLDLKDRKLPYIFNRKMKTNFLNFSNDLRNIKDISSIYSDAEINNYDIESAFYRVKNEKRDNNVNNVNTVSKNATKISHQNRNPHISCISQNPSSPLQSSLNSSRSSSRNSDKKIVTEIISEIFPEDDSGRAKIPQKFSQFFFVSEQIFGLKNAHIFGLVEGKGEEKEKFGLLGVDFIKRLFGDKEKYLEFCGIGKGKMDDEDWINEKFRGFDIDEDAMIYALRDRND